MGAQNSRSATARKVLAVGAGVAALGLGITATVAAWTDSEWVFGGNAAGDGPGIGTSTFEVQQNTDPAFAEGAWTDEEENPGGALTFGVEALSLTPGDSVYAPVALRTTSNSIGGAVTLQAAVEADGITANDPVGLLWDALELRVATDDAAFACDADAFTGGATVIADGDLSTEPVAAPAQTLLAASGSTQYYCFEITLPDPLPIAPGGNAEDYMGLTVAPAWQFEAESD